MSNWKDERQTSELDSRKLRALWDEGKTSGNPEPLDFRALRDEARRALKAASINNSE